jgi:hypothetical protein
METLIERGCGLDVHQATIVACLLVLQEKGQCRKAIRSFADVDLARIEAESQ